VGSKRRRKDWGMERGKTTGKAQVYDDLSKHHGERAGGERNKQGHHPLLDKKKQTGPSRGKIRYGKSGKEMS